MQRITETIALSALDASDALKSLTPKQAAAILLRVEGYTYREMAEELSISRHGAWYRVRRGMVRILLDSA